MFLPAGWVAEVSLAEDNSIKWSRELERDDHPRLLAGHVQPGDLRHVGGLLPLLSEGLNLAIGNLGRVEDLLSGGLVAGGWWWNIYLCEVEEEEEEERGVKQECPVCQPSPACNEEFN